MECTIECDEKELEIEPQIRENDFFISNEFQIEIKEQHTYTITKYVGISPTLMTQMPMLLKNLLT